MRVTPMDTNLYFRGVDSDDNKKQVSKKEVAVVTGAGGAAGSTVGNRISMKSFAEANRKFNQTTRGVRDGMNLAANTTNEAKTVFGQFVNNCRYYRDSLINFGRRATNSPILKPILQSRVYKGFAGFAGGAIAGCVAISGIGDMTTTFARKANELTNR